MHAPSRALRGSCLVKTLLAVAVVGLLALIVGAVVLVVQGSKAAAGLAPMSKLSSDAAIVQAPGSFDLQLSKGNTIVALVAAQGMPGRRAGGATAPAAPPSLSVTYAVTITDPEGKSVQVQDNPMAREATDIYYKLAAAEIPKDGLYKVEVKASDDTTPADIAVVSMATADFEAMRSAVWPVFWSTLGCFGACIGGVVGLVGLLGMFIARRFAPPPADPLAA